MEDSGTGGRAGFYSGSENDEFELRSFTSRPRTPVKKEKTKVVSDNKISPVISRSFGIRKKIS
jgi:hypothetical protein